MDSRRPFHALEINSASTTRGPSKRPTNTMKKAFKGQWPGQTSFPLSPFCPLSLLSLQSFAIASSFEKPTPIPLYPPPTQPPWQAGTHSHPSASPPPHTHTASMTNHLVFSILFLILSTFSLSPVSDERDCSLEQRSRKVFVMQWPGPQPSWNRPQGPGPIKGSGAWRHCSLVLRSSCEAADLWTLASLKGRTMGQVLLES